jgi:hypothetical protein
MPSTRHAVRAGADWISPFLILRDCGVAMKAPSIPALYVLEVVISRVRALDPQNADFQSECWEISSHIIGQRASHLGPLWAAGRRVVYGGLAHV